MATIGVNSISGLKNRSEISYGKRDFSALLNDNHSISQKKKWFQKRHNKKSLVHLSKFDQTQSEIAFGPISQLPIITEIEDSVLISCVERIVGRHAHASYDNVSHMAIFEIFRQVFSDKYGGSFMEKYSETFESSGVNNQSKMQANEVFWKKKQLRKIKGILKKNSVCQCLLLLKDFNLSSCCSLIGKRLNSIDDALEFFNQFELLSNDCTIYKTKINKQPLVTLTFPLKIQPISVSILEHENGESAVVEMSAVQNEESRKLTKTFKFPNQATMLALKYFFRDSWLNLQNPPVEWLNEDLPEYLSEWCNCVIQNRNFTTSYSAFVNSKSFVFPDELQQK